VKAPSGFQTNLPQLQAGDGVGVNPPADDDTFVKMCYFAMVLRMTAIFAFIAYKCSVRNGRKINLETEKWYGKQQ